MSAKKKVAVYNLIWTVLLFFIAFMCVFTVFSRIKTIWDKQASYNHLLVTEKKLKKERQSLETEVKNLGDEKAVILPEKNHKK